jgi:hypothetical protein
MRAAAVAAATIHVPCGDSKRAMVPSLVCVRERHQRRQPPETNVSGVPSLVQRSASRRVSGTARERRQTTPSTTALSGTTMASATS